MDEKGFLMGTALRCHVICRRSQRSPKQIRDVFWAWVTVKEAISGDGRVLSAMIINKERAHYMGWYAYPKKRRSSGVRSFSNWVEQ